MDLYARIGFAAFWTGVAVTAIPAIGLLLILASWLAPHWGISFNAGLIVFLGGWVFWAFVCPGISASPETYFTRVAMFLFFFPVMYPFIVVLMPWVLIFRSQQAKLHGTITIEGSTELRTEDDGDTSP